jgi:hypothetical protein
MASTQLWRWRLLSKDEAGIGRHTKTALLLPPQLDEQEFGQGRHPLPVLLLLLLLYMPAVLLLLLQIEELNNNNNVNLYEIQSNVTSTANELILSIVNINQNISTVVNQLNNSINDVNDSLDVYHHINNNNIIQNELLRDQIITLNETVNKTINNVENLLRRSYANTSIILGSSKRF